MKTEEEKKTSRKWIITIWCAVLLTIIIVTGLVSSLTGNELPAWLGTIGVILAGEICGYIGVNVWQKKIQKESDTE